MTDKPTLWLGTRPLLLASASTIRRQLLEQAGIPVTPYPVSLDEAGIAKVLIAEGASPAAIARTLSAAKAKEASRLFPDDIILAVDQTLEFEGGLGMKPTTIEAARGQLSAMRGKTHQLHAAACVVQGDKVLWAGCATAELMMRSFSSSFLERYLETMGETVCRTVGAYEFEALGAHLFDKAVGEHAAILGLPLAALLAAFRRLGLLLE